MKTLRLVLLSFFASAIALVLNDQVLFKMWYVVRTAGLIYIPFYYQYVVLLPLIAAVLIFGLTIKKWKKVCIVAVIFALSHQCYDFFAVETHYSSELVRYTTENPIDFWLVRSLIMFAAYLSALSAAWYLNLILKKPVRRIIDRVFSSSKKPVSSSDAVQNEPSSRRNKLKINEDNMSERITYHVLPDSSGWLVKKGKAKKASSVHKTKRKALRAASDLAKNHRLSQVIIHKASGVIESDRTFEHSHYRKKLRKRIVIRKIKKGLKRSRRKEYEARLRRRKAARLGIARLRRKRYLRRLAARKAAMKRKRR